MRGPICGWLNDYESECSTTERRRCFNPAIIGYDWPRHIGQALRCFDSYGWRYDIIDLFALEPPPPAKCLPLVGHSRQPG